MSKHKKQDKKKSVHQVSHGTSPVELRSGDKLRENPSNDEETISQTPGKGSEQGSPSQAPLSREYNEERKITNEEDQNEIVNPSGGDWDKPVENPTPAKKPYEEVNDDPDETQRKIPKM